jgi:hypothetical protein
MRVDLARETRDVGVGILALVLRELEPLLSLSLSLSLSHSHSLSLSHPLSLSPSLSLSPRARGWRYWRRELGTRLERA